jgi:organic radical activating enzyme
MEDFIREGGILNENIILMPGCDNAADLAERTKFAWEMAMRYHWRMCSRLHILCFNKLTGV